MNKYIFPFIAALFIMMILMVSSCKKSNTPALISETIPEKGDLLSFYKSFDPQILSSDDEEKIKPYLDKKAAVIYNYIKTNYNDTICGISDGKSANIILGGLVLAIQEKHLSANSSLNRNRVNSLSNQDRLYHCALGVLTGYESIKTLFSGTASLMTATEVITILKGFLARYVGYIGIAITVYEFGTCMDWFN